MKADIKLLGVEGKISKTNQTYNLWTTSIGPMSCFKSEINAHLLPLMGQSIELAIKEKGDFKNIVGVYGIPNVGEESKIVVGVEDLAPSQVQAAQPPGPAPTQAVGRASTSPFGQTIYNGQTPMYTRQTIDTFFFLYGNIIELSKDKNAVKEEILATTVMADAIALVKQAREAFK